VLSGVGGALRPLVVEVVGKRDVDGVDLGVGEQLLVGAVQPDIESALAEVHRAGIAPASDRDQLGVPGGEDGRDHHPAADVGGTHDAELDRLRQRRLAIMASMVAGGPEGGYGVFPKPIRCRPRRIPGGR
jgi:hypothetical protein